PRGINFSSPSGEPAVQMPVEDAATLKEILPESRRDSKATSVAGLNPRNTFESFVVGPNNEIAHAASLAVAQTPARTYNPLFMYGGVGLGKTHLMQAIGQYVWTKKKNTKVMYLSSELFINEFIDAIQHSNLVKFRKRYRQADVLLIDDIQFLGGKERSQEEFFHTFNTLFDGHNQIVLCVAQRKRAHTGSRRASAERYFAGRGTPFHYDRTNPAAGGRTFRCASCRYDEQTASGQHRLSAAGRDVSGARAYQGIAQ